MQEKFLKEVVSIVVGRQAEEIASLLNSKKHVNEFNIAKKLDLTINQTRNILYKLADEGLVTHERKKDKKKGWYTYFWRIEPLKALVFLEAVLQKRINQLKDQINNREKKVFYYCETCNLEYSEEHAILHDFICDECGNVFSLKDNTKVIKEFQKHLNKKEKELEEVREELREEREKQEKLKQRRIKRKEKKKKKERAAKRTKRKKEREAKKAKEEKEEGKSKKKKTKKTKKSSKKKPLGKKTKTVKSKSKKKTTKKKPKKKTSKKKKASKKKSSKSKRKK